MPKLLHVRRAIRTAIARLHIRHFFSLPVLIIALVIIALVSGSTATLHLNSSLRTSLLQSLASLPDSTKQGLAIHKPVPTPAPVQPAIPARDPIADNPNITKYATSPDPRSTAYSLTPPAPNPASFETRITHNGQLPAGSVLAYNATKGDKTYYGGDLVFNPATLTISISNFVYENARFVASAPDGTAISMPSLPWYVTNSAVFPGYHTDPGNWVTPSSATTWPLAMFLASGITPGTYQAHLISTRASSGPDSWEYDGFLTVVVAP